MNRKKYFKIFLIYCGQFSQLLLSILFIICTVFAGTDRRYHRDAQVSRGGDPEGALRAMVERLVLPGPYPVLGRPTQQGDQAYPPPPPFRLITSILPDALSCVSVAAFTNSTTSVTISPETIDLCRCAYAVKYLINGTPDSKASWKRVVR